MSRAFLLLLLILPARSQDELLLRWNQFAKDANEFIQTTDVNPQHRQKQKEKLAREWNLVYPLL